MAEAELSWVSGPVIRARPRGVFSVSEAVEVGPNRLLGEVIRLAREEIVVQVYEDTTGLRPGDAVTGRGQPLSARLGPGLLGGIFDGLLRPLGSGDIHVQPGMRLRPPARVAFAPRVRIGDRLRGGEAFGEIVGSEPRQHCLLPPGLSGEVTHVEPAGEYDEDSILLQLRDASGRERGVGVAHDWPVRTPRPVQARLPVRRPLVTGQRILDTLFPVGRGGKAALPGGFGTGKTVLQEALAKWCDADVIVYVGCGERGNEMAGLLKEFPELQDPRSGHPLMRRTVVIANTSNMPVAAREASIYTGVTVAEYFRDQGLHVALMADSTSRWAEALREVSGRLGELPGEGGYPAYLSSRLASFYERAGRVTTLAGQEGSLTLIGAVSPPSGDFSEPVTTHTKRYVRSFWVLDRDRAQARFFPAIHPLQSYAENAELFADWWAEQGNPAWLAQRRLLLHTLEQRTQVARMARIVGVDALPPRQRCLLFCGDLINEAFLRQSSFSPTDRYASPGRQSRMLQLVARFTERALAAVDAGIDMAHIAELPLVRPLMRMGEELGEQQLDAYERLAEELEAAFDTLVREMRDAG